MSAALVKSVELVRLRERRNQRVRIRATSREDVVLSTAFVVRCKAKAVRDSFHLTPSILSYESRIAFVGDASLIGVVPSVR